MLNSWYILLLFPVATNLTSLRQSHKRRRAVRDITDAVDVNEDVVIADFVDCAFEFADHEKVRGCRVTADEFRVR